MAKRAASSESPPNLSQSTDGSDPDDDLIQFVGPMTVQDVGNAFLANRTLNGFPNTIIISLVIGGIDFIWQNLTQQQLRMPFVDFVNLHVINSASASRLRRIRQLLLDDRDRIFFSFTANDIQGGGDRNYDCIYTMDGLHFNKKIPRNKGRKKKAQDYLLIFPLESIEELVDVEWHD